MVIIWAFVALAIAAVTTVPDDGASFFEEKREVYGFWRATLIVLIVGAFYSVPVMLLIWAVRKCAELVVYR